MASRAKGRSGRRLEPAGGEAGERATNGFIWQRARVEAGLKRLGIEDRCDIVVADAADRVEATAAERLRRFLAIGGLNARIAPESRSSGAKRFLLGRPRNHASIGALADAGELNVLDISTEDDGFHLKRAGGDIAVAAANPRGVLYGVYAFEDSITAGARGPLDDRRAPRFGKRGSGPLYLSLFSRYINILTEDLSDEKAAYLSRLTINQVTSQGIGDHLQQLVTSDVFPFLPPPDPDMQRKIRSMSAVCRKYGMDHYLWFSEPYLRKDAGILAQYPREALGKVRRPWGGGPDGMDTTLCVNSAMVREHLRSSMRKLVREFPDVKGVLLYNLDSQAWLCTPRFCERCSALCGESSQDQFTPWETQASLVSLLASAAHEENPEFEIIFWGSAHYHGETFTKMIHAARGYDRLASCWNASDRSVMVPTTAQIDPAFVLSKKICTEGGVPFHGLFEFNNLESVPESLPFPFHVCDAVKRYAEWGVPNLTEIYGVVAEHNPINALVTKALQWEPDLNPEEFLADLARRQFGPEAGRLMYRAWEQIREAFRAWNDLQFGPLDGSQQILSIGLAVGLPPPSLAEVVTSYNRSVEVLTNVEPWRADGYRLLKERAFLDRMELMNRHLAQAAEMARRAVEVASSEQFIDVCHYEGPYGRPTCREYAELNYAPIAIAEAICGQRCNMLRAYHLLTEMEEARRAGDEESARTKEVLHREVVREDVGVRERFRELLLGFARMRPCLTRMSLTEHAISDVLAENDARISAMKAFLDHTEAEPWAGRGS